jgi:hypothetical protein
MPHNADRLRSNSSYDLLSVIQSVPAMPFPTVNPKKFTTSTEQATETQPATCDTDIIVQVLIQQPGYMQRPRDLAVNTSTTGTALTNDRLLV